jgi:ketosteroid isomerase-like protein
MSAENVELVRRAGEAAMRKPKPDFDTVNELYHPDHEFVSRITGVEGQSFRGARGFRDWLAHQADAWESWHTTVEEVTTLDEDRVLAVIVFHAKSRRTSVPIEDRFVAVYTIRGGKIIRTETYRSREQAAESVRPRR